MWFGRWLMHVFKMDDCKNLISTQLLKTRETLIFNTCPQGVARQKRWRGCVSRRRCWSEVRVHKMEMGWEERHFTFCYDHHNHDGNVHEDDDHGTPSQPQEQWELSEQQHSSPADKGWPSCVIIIVVIINPLLRFKSSLSDLFETPIHQWRSGRPGLAAAGAR